PDLLVCDEITSALDVSVQAAIMELLAGLRRSMGLSLLFVTHNLALIRTIADRVAVMSGGRIIETGAAEAIFAAPQAAYTRERLAHAPGLGWVAWRPVVSARPRRPSGAPGRRFAAALRSGSSRSERGRRGRRPSPSRSRRRPRPRRRCARCAAACGERRQGA